MEGLIDYSRQSEFDELFMRERRYNNYTHVIIGTGGVGFWLALILAMQGIEKFMLVDGQDVDISNLNRLPVPPTWRGQKKVIALRKIIRQLRPMSQILTFSNHVGKDNMNTVGEVVRKLGGSYKIWDCTDDARIQRMIFKWAQHGNIQYRKIGYEAFEVGTYTNYDVWTTEDYRPGYRTSNACAATSALAAVVGLFADGLGLNEDINLNIKEILQEQNRGGTHEQEPSEDVVSF